MTKILAIDPGPKESAWVLMQDLEIHSCNKELNESIIKALWHDTWGQDIIALEYVVAYGRSGREVSDTAFESGRLVQSASSSYKGITRSKVRGHLCGRGGSDSKIITTLIERFCHDIYQKWVNKQLSRQKMINAARDEYFKEFTADIWQAYALGVTYYDLN